MKVLIGSIIVVLLLCLGAWLIISPAFTKVGDTAKKMKKNLEEDKNGNEK
ncbi:hypothetical protein ACN6MY_15025 [Peribacillus sp. B-H-3]